MRATALIISTGQDSKNLCEILLEKGVNVTVSYRYSSLPLDERLKDYPNKDIINWVCMDICDPSSVNSVITENKFDYIFNLAALSQVHYSFEQPYQYILTDGVGPLNVLEAVRLYSPISRLYNAGSSEEVGNNIDSDGFQRITTPLKAKSPYAAAKILSRNLTSIYRESYNIFAVTGLLFNHTSIYRTPPDQFIESKIANYIGKMINYEKSNNLRYPNKLKCGNLTSHRDFGWSKDYMRAAWLMLNTDEPKDYVVATGETHSIKEIMEYMFNRVNRNYLEYIQQVQEFMRPNDVTYLKGDSNPIRKELRWKPTKTFHELMDMLVDHFIRVNK